MSSSRVLATSSTGPFVILGTKSPRDEIGVLGEIVAPLSLIIISLNCVTNFVFCRPLSFNKNLQRM